MKKRFIFPAFTICAFLLLNPYLHQAFASEEIEASAKYVLGDNDSKLDGRRLALLEAKRNAIEKVGTYVESITEVKNLKLSHDQIRSYTVGIIEVQVYCPT